LVFLSSSADIVGVREGWVGGRGEEEEGREGELVEVEVDLSELKASRSSAQKA